MSSLRVIQMTSQSHDDLKAAWRLATTRQARPTHVVDHDVDSLDIDTSTKDIGSDQDTFLELFEHLVTGDTV